MDEESSDSCGVAICVGRPWAACNGIGLETCFADAWNVWKFLSYLFGLLSSE
jgi:hypothetical protein